LQDAWAVEQTAEAQPGRLVRDVFGDDVGHWAAPALFAAG